MTFGLRLHGQHTVTARVKAGSAWLFVEEEGGGQCGQSPSGRLGRKMILDTEVGRTWGALGAELPLPPENTPAAEAGQGCALGASLCLLWEWRQGRAGADAALAAGHLTGSGSRCVLQVALGGLICGSAGAQVGKRANGPGLGGISGT